MNPIADKFAFDSTNYVYQPTGVPIDHGPPPSKPFELKAPEKPKKGKKEKKKDKKQGD